MKNIIELEEQLDAKQAPELEMSDWETVLEELGEKEGEHANLEALNQTNHKRT